MSSRSTLRRRGGLRLDRSLRGGPRRTVRSARARALPLALGAGLAVSLVATVAYCLRLQSYFVMPDELGYVEQATFMGSHLRPLVPGDVLFGSWSQLEPLLLALPYGLLPTPAAFDIGHVLNALALVSTAWPVLLLARRVTGSERAAALVAVLTVAVPWMTLAGAQLTENVAYPTFAWSVLAAYSAIVEPRPRNDLLLLLAAAAAYTARTQLGLVAVAALVGVVVHEVGWAWRGEPRRGLSLGLRRSVTGHPVLLAAALVAAAFLAVFSIHDVLGAYDAPAQGDLLPPGTWSAARELLAQVSVGIGGAPLALTAAWLLATFAAPADRRAHALASVVLPTLTVLAIATGSFSDRFTGGLNDRYLFFVAPVLFLGAIMFVRDRRRLLGPLLVGTVAGGALVGTATLGQRGPSLVSPAAAFHDVIAHVGDVPLVAAIAVAAVGVGLGVARAARVGVGAQAAVLGALLLAFCATETAYTMDRVASTQTAGQEFLDGRDFIDQAVPGRGDVAALLSVFPDGSRYESVGRWWDVTFWNSDVRRILRFGDPEDLNQKASTPLELDPRSGALKGLGADRWLVVSAADARLALRGRPAGPPRFGLRILRLPGAPSARWAWDGLTAGGRIPLGGTSNLRVWQRAGRARFVLDGAGAARDVRVRVRVGARDTVVRVPREGSTVVRVRLSRRTVAPLPSIVLLVLGAPPEDPLADLGPRLAATRLSTG